MAEKESKVNLADYESGARFNTKSIDGAIKKKNLEPKKKTTLKQGGK